MKKVLICFLMLLCIKAYAGNSTASCHRPYFIPDIYEIESCSNYSELYGGTILVSYNGKFGVFVNKRDSHKSFFTSSDTNPTYSKLIVPAQFDEIKFARYGFIVIKNGKYGYYNMTKGKVFDPIYDRIYFSDNDEIVSAQQGLKVVSKENTKCRPAENENAVGDIFFNHGF